MTDETSVNRGAHAPIPRQVMEREVKITKKAAFWVVFSAGTLALVAFSLMFLHAAARNGWGSFGS